jgi:hypothetical protein
MYSGWKKKIVASVTFQLLPADPTVNLLKDQYTQPPTSFQFLKQIQLCAASVNTMIVIIIGVFLFISILAIKEFQNCSIATKIMIDKPNSAMFSFFSLESPWDSYSSPPHPIFMFSGTLIDSQIFFCIDMFFLLGTVLRVRVPMRVGCYRQG